MLDINTPGTEGMSRGINETRSGLVLVNAGAEWRLGFIILPQIILNKKG